MNEWLVSQLAQMWRNERRCAHTKTFVHNADPGITKQILNMSKADTRMVIGLLTGHCKLNHHLARLRIRDDPDCDLCGTTTETAIHIICECSGVARIRQNIYGVETILPADICKFPLHKLVFFFKQCCESHIHLANVF